MVPVRVVVVAVTTGNSEWRTLGNTSREAFRTAVARSWMAEPSPMRAQADAVYDALAPVGMTRLGAAMAWHESKNGSWNCATAPAGQPCIPASRHNAWAMKAGDGTWMRYADYAEAAADWAERLLHPGGPYKATATVRELIEVYAPSWDGNDVGRYVEQVCREVDALPLAAGETPVEPTTTNPFRKPVLYSLDKDFARFGLTAAQARKIAGHKFDGRQGQSIEAVVLHIMEGTVAGSLSWWASGNADASSSVMVGKDGSLLRVIEDRHGPWTNGDVNQPTAKGKGLLDAIGWRNPNLASVTIEAEGYSGDAPTEAMVETICWMVTEWMSRHFLDLDDIYKHADINSVTRAGCPGAYYDVVMKRLREAGKPPEPPGPAVPAWPGKPAWLDERLIPLLFPEADPAGKRTRGWFAYCTFAKRAPARKAFLFKGTPDELIQFDDGLLIDLEGRQVGNP